MTDKTIPAYPQPLTQPEYNESRITSPEFMGMTLRDYFAAQALPELVDKYEPETVASIAYCIAYHMLKEREK